MSKTFFLVRCIIITFYVTTPLAQCVQYWIKLQILEYSAIPPSRSIINGIICRKMGEVTPKTQVLKDKIKKANLD